MMEHLTPILVIVLLVALNGLFVAAEFAMMAAKLPRIQQVADQGNRVAQWTLDLFRSSTGKDRYIAVCQLGITLASIGLGMYGEKAIASWLYGPLEHYGHVGHAMAHTLGTVIALAIITFMHVVFGEMVPKGLALSSPERVTFSLSVLMKTFLWVFRPLVWLLNTIALALLRLLKIKDVGSGERLYTSEELEYLFHESAESGQLDLSEDIIEGIFDFGDRTVGEVMTPRNQIEALHVRTPPQQLVELIEKAKYSRYLVVDRYLDQVLGYVHVKDLIRTAHQNPRDLRLPRLRRPIPTFPESLHLSEAMVLLKKRKAHMAVVQDEYGGTAGIVTLQDLIDEVMGSNEIHLEQLAEGQYLLQGEAPLEVLEELVGQDLSGHEDETVGTWVVHQLGQLASLGDVVQTPHFRLEVTEVDTPRVTRLLLQLGQVSGQNETPPSPDGAP